ncbi:NADH dehydrogenase [ubiquinone] 1 alpha subcomplex assembly factor 2 isoform X4 [Orcinus orca]|uniref:NADH dehydrogenase [ubiquinone] 1 alpha subcomplex assembly factor 2 isoform X4 n=1 Tax=Orcinus orca TaxID=9733 RepID=UPI0021111963|nr:NADH dehydrogenase [ubiquinone] 1 alpha subcomplex assembly factor 2 isoform X4 [Orcinus orca]
MLSGLSSHQYIPIVEFLTGMLVPLPCITVCSAGPVSIDQCGFRNVVYKMTSAGQTIREKRIVESANKREIDYEVGDIPAEWEAWIRKTRKTPPTMEEIMKNEKHKEEIKTKDFYEKEKLLREESSKEHLAPPVQTQIKGHASAPYFGKEESSVAPTSTGKTFQPGSWMPQDGKSHNQ